MATLVIIGAQWGDEAKGKMVDVLSTDATMVVRYSGGNNAGHTVIVGDETFKFHLLPAGILYPHVTAILGGGMAICPKSLLEELDRTQSSRSVLGTLVISPAAHVVFPYHRLLDQLEEEARGQNKIGTTSRGIGPCYTDKVQRNGIRIGELVNPPVFQRRLREVLSVKNQLLNLFGHPPLDFDEMLAEFSSFADRLRPFVRDIETLVQDAVKAGDRVMFEGAQGTFLDLDHGTYPYVTSSHPVSAGACLGTGIGPRDINSVLGVCKAYTTRVGSGPFPSELLDQTGDKIREQGHEYGTTTGRPRRCGWLDLVALKHSARVNSLSGLILTRIDVLSGIGALKLVTQYSKAGNAMKSWPINVEDWVGIEPVYSQLTGWNEDISSCKTWDELPATVQAYVRFVEDFTETPAAILSIGPERSQTIILRPDLIWG